MSVYMALRTRDVHSLDHTVVFHQCSCHQGTWELYLLIDIGEVLHLEPLSTLLLTKGNKYMKYDFGYYTGGDTANIMIHALL